jgi:hypothetical protein
LEEGGSCLHLCCNGFSVLSKKMNNMTPKNASMIAYVTIIGWAAVYFSKGEKKEFTCYHLGQSLGIHITTLVYAGIARLALAASAGIASVLYWAGILFFLLPVFGIIHAFNETERPVPLIGKFFENRFSFIK